MIEINGKIYRNLQEQVKKNMEDIEDTNTRIDNLNLKKFEDEDDEYKTILEIKPDDVYVTYIDKEEPDVEHTFGVVSIGYQLNNLSQRHLYEHSIFVNGKLKDAGVTKDDFTFGSRFRILNNSSTAITADTIASAINTSTIPATGYTHYTTNESEETIFSIQTSILDRNVLEIGTVPTQYTPAGLSSSVVGEITYIKDNVRQLI